MKRLLLALTLTGSSCTPAPALAGMGDAFYRLSDLVAMADSGKTGRAVADAFVIGAHDLGSVSGAFCSPDDIKSGQVVDKFWRGAIVLMKAGLVEEEDAAAYVIAKVMLNAWPCKDKPSNDKPSKGSRPSKPARET